ncbi:MAG: SCO family protein [Planctomycetaceae bacterium]|jgi:cytochrome oxidase Cu insertion factor (SCO1/SenC/PrrC family)|nr:SCO family protein [Planctomycetaceae bacterium]MBT6459171.1 SCO family protein [Planctomycetaceae bacterium]MBT6643303.1 SCO family protein [Planctomycetaceae bacterium]MBT6919672.1 SCO family protein [Planctomycetaceae bacterium]MBT7729753.1 SCO family protein [Planctomycetaceae bacterium]
MNIKKLTYSLSRVGLSLLTVCLIGCGNSNDSPKTKVLLESKDAGDVGISSDVSLPVFKKGEPAARFELTDQEGNQFDSATLKGKVWMGSVFFANCPGPCFRENQAIADIVREIDDPNFIAVSLTCDPENDTPAALAHYADRFEADPQRWKFLTGDMDVIKRVGTKTFLLPVEIGVHSERGAVFDREGRLRGSYHLLQEDRVERLKKLIRDVLAEEDATARVEETD